MSKKELIIPKMGESIFEAEIIKWYKSPGQHIKKGELIAEISTDKINSELISEYNGEIVDILYDEGNTVEVGSPIAIINAHTSDKSIQSPTDDEIHHQVSIQNSKREIPSKKASPLAKKIVLEENLSQKEYDSIPSYNIENKLKKNDVFNYLNRISHHSSQTPSNIFSILPGDTVIDNNIERKIISKKMTSSYSQIPQVTVFCEADVSRIVEFRSKNKDKLTKKDIYLTYNPFFIKAVADTLAKNPKFNSYFHQDKIIMKKNINIGYAVNVSENSLTIPVIKNANKINFTEIIKKTNYLTNLALRRKLLPDDTSDCTYTISNIGSLSCIMGTPLINPPQVSILGFGSIMKKFDIEKYQSTGQLRICHKIMISHTFDHRIFDGAEAINFANHVGSYLENFDLKEQFPE